MRTFFNPSIDRILKSDFWASAYWLSSIMKDFQERDATINLKNNICAGLNWNHSLISKPLERLKSKCIDFHLLRS